MSVIGHNYGVNNTISVGAVNITSDSLITMNGKTRKVQVTAGLEVNGRDVLKELDEMRDALLLLKREIDMEARYPRLKEIKDMYDQELEKYKTFERLK
jgi:hypothetical protein